MVLSNLLAMPNYMKLFKCIRGRLVAHSSSTESDTESANEFSSVSHIFFFFIQLHYFILSTVHICSEDLSRL